VRPANRTDQGDSRFQTLRRTIHMIPAVVAFGGLVWAATGLWATLRLPGLAQRRSLPHHRRWLMPGSVIAVVLAIPGPRLKPYFGAFERLFQLSSLA
jgi:hypothetical protein